MNALSTATRSIGQMLFETLHPKTTTLWVDLLAGTRDHYERAAEIVFHRGFKAGSEAQKIAAPPPRAKELKAQLGELAEAARAYIEAQKADHVGTRVKAREELATLLEAVK